MERISFSVEGRTNDDFLFNSSLQTRISLKEMVKQITMETGKICNLQFVEQMARYDAVSVRKSWKRGLLSPEQSPKEAQCHRNSYKRSVQYRQIRSSKISIVVNGTEQSPELGRVLPEWSCKIIKRKKKTFNQTSHIMLLASKHKLEPLCQ